jgi:hypothetical protein
MIGGQNSNAQLTRVISTPASHRALLQYCTRVSSTSGNFEYFCQGCNLHDHRNGRVRNGGCNAKLPIKI